MRKSWIVFAAVLIAAAAYTAPPASAGIRIGFGFPLGAFTAHPSHGPSYNRGHRRSHEASDHYRKKRAVASARAAERARIARMREVQQARQARAAAAARENAASAKAAAAKTREKTRETDSDKTNETAAASEPAPLAPAPIAVPGAAPVATAVEPGMVQTTATIGAPAPVTAPVESSVVKATAAPASTPSGSKSKKADCRKFVPAVGLTISAPCE